MADTLPILHPRTFSYRRFHVLENRPGIDPGALAFDTATGRLCRSYDWSFLETAAFKKSGLDRMPLCEDLVFVTPVMVNDPATGKDHQFMSVKSAAEFQEMLNAKGAH